MSPETLQFAPDTPEEARAKKSREEDKQKLKAKLARPKQPNPEALAAVQQMSKKQLEELRAKLADIEPTNFAEGTGKIPLTKQDELELTEEDLEEIK